MSQPATAAQSAGVVLIDTVLPYQDAQAAGTGMVLTASGQVLTNYHVVEGAGTITVTVAATGQSYPATVVGTDPTDDVALLQLTGASGLTTVKADDDQAQVGDAVTAVGNAGGTGTLTAADGTISSLTSSVTAASEGSSGSETLASMIETTADVVSGDSGGPLFDAEGEVVGIDTAASTGSEIDGYAIPIARALGIVDQIRSGAETSTVRIGPAAFLGVELSSGTPMYGYGGGVRDQHRLRVRGDGRQRHHRRRRCRCGPPGRRRHHQPQRAVRHLGHRRQHRPHRDQPRGPGHHRVDRPGRRDAYRHRGARREPGRLTRSAHRPWLSPPHTVC